MIIMMRRAGNAAGALALCVLLALAAYCCHRRDAAALLGEYDGGGKMSKGLGVQAHDLGWDGGQDYRSSGVTYSRLAVSGVPTASVQESQPGWEDLTSAPPAYSNGVPAYSNTLAYSNAVPAYSNSVAAYANLPGAPTSRGVDADSADNDSWFPNWDELTSSRPDEQSASSAAPIASSGAAEGLHSAIDTGLKAAWDSLAGVVRVHGCDAACLKDIYRRAFRAHSTHLAHSQGHTGPTEQERVAERDRKLFGQVPSEVDVSPSSFSDAYRDVSSIGVTAAPKVLGILANYLPQAVSAEKQLARAIAQVCRPLFPACGRAERCALAVGSKVRACGAKHLCLPRSWRRCRRWACTLTRPREQRKYGQRAANAYSRAAMRRRAADQEHHSQFQYKLKLNDEFDAQGQRHLRRFVKDEDAEECEEGQECEEKQGGGGEGGGEGDWHVVVDEKTHQPVEESPLLMCGEGDKKEEGTFGKLDRMDDCTFKDGDEDSQKYYNRMFYLDREKSGHPASARLIHNHMLGVKKLVDKWKPLLVGAGGGSGEPGAYDDPYYFCYDQYQEDPEFSQCLRDLSEHSKTFKIRKWARPALAGPGDGDAPMRPGFPNLREEWEKAMEKDPTDSSLAAPEVEPYGGSDWFKEYY